MQYQPPQKGYSNQGVVKNEVKVPVAPTASQGVDHNGIVLGRWKASPFGCCDTLIPNACMAFVCPGVSLAQITARLGLYSFYHVIGVYLFLIGLGIITAALHSDFLNSFYFFLVMIFTFMVVNLRWKIRTLFAIPGSAVEDCLLTFACGCCSLAQMATHVESYEPGACSFLPRATLPGYNQEQPEYV